MKRQIIAIALGSVFALPALANNEIDAGAPGTVYGSNQSELVFVNAEQGYEHKPMLVAAKSRAQVRAEVAEAQRSGEFIVNAELGTTAKQL